MTSEKYMCCYSLVGPLSTWMTKRNISPSTPGEKSSKLAPVTDRESPILAPRHSCRVYRPLCRAQISPRPHGESLEPVGWLKNCKVGSYASLSVCLSVWSCETHVVHHLNGIGLHCASRTCLSVWPPHDAVVGCRSRKGHMGQGQRSHGSKSN